MSMPWPTYSAQTWPLADNARPAAVQMAPMLVVARMPMRSATQPIRMPPSAGADPDQRSGQGDDRAVGCQRRLDRLQPHHHEQWRAVADGEHRQREAGRDPGAARPRCSRQRQSMVLDSGIAGGFLQAVCRRPVCCGGRATYKRQAVWTGTAAPGKRSKLHD